MLGLLPRGSAPLPGVTIGAGDGALVTYTIDAMPALSPGTYAGFTIVSLVPNLGGTPLASMGMPGCSQYLGTFDLFLFCIGSTPSLTTTLSLPAGLPGGTTLFAQAIALFPPNSLPNGMNPFGAVTSNAIASFVNDH